jgi:hypothetical protein
MPAAGASYRLLVAWPVQPADRTLPLTASAGFCGVLACGSSSWVLQFVEEGPFSATS